MSGITSSDSGTPTDAEPLNSAAVPATPSGAVAPSNVAPGAAAPSSGAVSETDVPQTGAVGGIIDTPPKILEATKAAPLLDDYEPAPTDRSLVLTAAVPASISIQARWRPHRSTN